MEKHRSTTTVASGRNFQMEKVGPGLRRLARWLERRTVKEKLAGVVMIRLGLADGGHDFRGSGLYSDSIVDDLLMDWGGDLDAADEQLNGEDMYVLDLMSRLDSDEKVSEQAMRELIAAA